MKGLNPFEGHVWAVDLGMERAERLYLDTPFDRNGYTSQAKAV